jgi:transcriptional regulator GlxA family with amidase domain
MTMAQSASFAWVNPEIIDLRAISVRSRLPDQQGRPRVGRPRKLDGDSLVHWQVQKLTEFVEENIEGPLRVKELARQVNLSVSRFSCRFANTFGRPPYDYVMSRRIEAAKALLEDGSEPIGQIACACGLHDQAHLSRLFKRQTGLTPRQWRVQHLSGSRRDGNVGPSSRTPSTRRSGLNERETRNEQHI